EDMGAKSGKNIARPVRVHRVQLAERPKVSIAVEKPAGQGVPAARKALRVAFRTSWRIVRAVVVLIVVLIVLYRWVMPPITPYMLVRLPEAGKIEQRTVSLGAISPDLPRALIAAEDHHFCVH